MKTKMQADFWTSIAVKWVQQLSTDRIKDAESLASASIAMIEGRLQELGTLNSILSAKDEILLLSDDEDDNDFI